VLPEEPSSCLLDTFKLEAVDVTGDPLELPEDSKSSSELLSAVLQQQEEVTTTTTTTTTNDVVTFRRSSRDVAAICNSLAEEATFRDVIIYPGDGRPPPVHCCSVLLAALSPALRNVLASAERNAAGQFELIAPDLGGESRAELVSLMARVSSLLALPGSGGVVNVMRMGRELWQFLGHGLSRGEVTAGDTGTERQADMLSWGAGVLGTSVTTALEGRRVEGNTGIKRPGPASRSLAKRSKTAAPESVAAAAPALAAAAAPALSITAVRAPPAVSASVLAANAAAPVLAATPAASVRAAAAAPALTAAAAPALDAPESAGLADRTTAGIGDLQGRGISGPDKPNGVVMLAGDRFGSVISALGGRELGGGDLIARDLSGGREEASTRFFR
jgi:hypothetical protein